MSIVHPIEPLFNDKSRVLILGSFPSVKSREAVFFYGHKQNRFWRVIARVFDTDAPESIEDKKKLILDNGLALWDVIHSCDITGSADSSIKNVVPNDLSVILNNCDIKAVFVNGKTAEALYKKHLEKRTGIKAEVLPSTSPANARWSEDMLYEYWNDKIKKSL